MRMQIRAILEKVSFLLLTLLLVPVVSGASPPTTGSGTFLITSLTIISTELSDGNTIITSTHTSTFTGILSGTNLIEDRIIIHPNSVVTAQGRGTYSGDIAGGSSGTAALTYQAVGYVGPDGIFGTADDTLQGSFQIDRGTGGLDGVHIQGTFMGVFSGTYEVNVHFDP